MAELQCKKSNGRPIVLTVLLTSLFVVSMFAVLPVNSSTQNNLNLKVESINYVDSHPIFGLYVVLRQNGQVVASGFTWTTFSVTSGETYSIQAYNNASCTFSYWDIPNPGGFSNNYSNPMTFTATQNFGQGEMALMAEYSCGSSNGSSSTLAVTSQNTNGQTISGYYTILYNSDSRVVGTGFTPATFSLNNGATYSVQVDNYKSCNFAK